MSFGEQMRIGLQNFMVEVMVVFDFKTGYIVAEARYFLLWGFYSDFGIGTWTNRKGFESDEDEDLEITDLY